MSEIEEKAAKIEEKLQALLRGIGKSSLYEQNRKLAKDALDLAGQIRRDAHNPFAVGGGM